MLRTYFFNPIRHTAVVGLSIFISGCAILHHVQVGSIDNRTSDAVLIPFEIKMSETGISTEEIGKIARATKSRGGDDVAGAAGILSLFQMGPKTGNLTYNENYAKNLVYEIHQRCPSGQVTGLMSVREMRKYPAISGEIVKVTGFCRKPRIAAPQVGQIENSESNAGEI
jgi:hypothetical protein